MQHSASIRDRSAQHHAAFDAHVSVQVGGETLCGVLDAELAHEADPAHVDANDRDRVLRDGVDGAKNRAVAPGDDHQRGLRQQVGAVVDLERRRHPRLRAEVEAGD